jgi:hypothetical protein
MAQAFSRVLRLQREWDVHVHFLTCRGIIEEYMELLCDCKRKAIAEGLAHLRRDDFRLEDCPTSRLTPSPWSRARRCCGSSPAAASPPATSARRARGISSGSPVTQ